MSWYDAYVVGCHECGSCGRQHYGSYEMWCRAERQRLFPAHFATCTEEEHKARRSGLTYEQQLAVWHHRDTWEAMYDGELSEAQARTLLANSDPLPPISALTGMMRVLARGMTGNSRQAQQPQPGRAEIPELTREQEAYLMAAVNPVTPERLEQVREQLGLAADEDAA